MLGFSAGGQTFRTRERGRAGLHHEPINTPTQHIPRLQQGLLVSSLIITIFIFLTLLSQPCQQTAVCRLYQYLYHSNVRDKHRPTNFGHIGVRARSFLWCWVSFCRIFRNVSLHPRCHEMLCLNRLLGRLYGIACLQTFEYFRSAKAKTDPWGIKVMVRCLSLPPNSD